MSPEPASGSQGLGSSRGGLAAVEVGLVSVPRFQRALDRFGPRLLARVFCEAEVAYAQRKRDGTHNLAARFAAKCAGRRALRRLGLRAGWHELEVVRRRSGEPTLLLPGSLPLAPATRLSLTHDPAFAAATLFIERGAGR